MRSFSSLLGNGPRVKILEFLIIGRELEYHIKDISEGSEVSRPTCHREIHDMQKQGLVIKGMKYQGKQLYRLNRKDYNVQEIIRLFDNLLVHAL